MFSRPALFSALNRHLCEFTELDLEMEFKEHYLEVLAVIGNMLQRGEGDDD